MSTELKTLAVFGATGTIGDNTLDIVRQHPDLFQINILTAQKNAEKLVKLAKEFTPKHVVITDDTYYHTVRDALPSQIAVHSGEQGLCDAAISEYNMMVSAIVGFPALKPTLCAIRAGKDIALANKECLVAAGELFMQECRKHHTTLLPIDSEHNGLFQIWNSLHGVRPEKVMLTASGGPFRTFSKEQMQSVTPAQAIAHPNWSMGAKISVDSATMMNKGLELIEALHLFSLNADMLDVLVHPESIMHCLITLTDGSQLAQMSLPDMRTPIAQALHYPKRLNLNIPKLSLNDIGQLRFEAADTQRFPCLSLAYRVMEHNGAAATILNAANEVAVDAFLKGMLTFTEIASTIESILEKTEHIPITNLDDVFHINHITHIKTKELVS